MNEKWIRYFLLQESGRVDKVVEYLLKSHEENPCLAQDDSSDFLSKSTSSCHIFYLYPKDRSLFLTLFSFAKSKAMKKGFFADYWYFAIFIIYLWNEQRSFITFVYINDKKIF